jgi:hypothetical protein
MSKSGCGGMLGCKLHDAIHYEHDFDDTCSFADRDLHARYTGTLPGHAAQHRSRNSNGPPLPAAPFNNEWELDGEEDDGDMSADEAGPAVPEIERALSSAENIEDNQPENFRGEEGAGSCVLDDDDQDKADGEDNGSSSEEEEEGEDDQQGQEDDGEEYADQDQEYADI